MAVTADSIARALRHVAETSTPTDESFLGRAVIVVSAGAQITAVPRCEVRVLCFGEGPMPDADVGIDSIADGRDESDLPQLVTDLGVWLAGAPKGSRWVML